MKYQLLMLITSFLITTQSYAGKYQLLENSYKELMKSNVPALMDIETKQLSTQLQKSKFKETVHTFSWYDLKDNFLGYWIMSDDLKNIEEIKFDRNGKIFSVGSICSEFNNNNNIGELVWE